MALRIRGKVPLVSRVGDSLTISSEVVEDLVGGLVPDERLRIVVPVW